MSEPKASLDSLRIDHDARPASAGGRGRWWIVAVVAIVVLVAIFLWLRSGSRPTVRTAPVEAVSSTGAASAGSVLQSSGYVVARRQATVSSKVTGKVVDVLVEEGMRLEDGQIVARLDDSIERRQAALDRAQLAAAESALAEIEVRIAEARLNLDRTANLVAAEVATEAQLDADRASVEALEARLAASRDEVEVAERALALTRQRLDDLVIRSPFAGVAISKDAQPGEMISPVSAGGGFTRTGICTVVDMSSLEIEVDVNEAYINRVEPGQRVEAVLNAYPDWTIPASVITTIPAAERDKATVKVRIAFDELDPRILPDMGVRVSFLDREPAGDETAAVRLFVPQEAIVRAEGRDVVWVVAGERVERRAISVGGERDGRVEIKAGLANGERVVLDPPEGLEDGAPIKVEG